MKRTAKWHKHLTLAELRHLKEWNALSLVRFQKLRQDQERQKAESLARWPDLHIGAAEPCFDCRHIEFKLREAGVLK
jgi:hypothetical protein